MLNICAILSALERHSEASIYAKKAVAILEQKAQKIIKQEKEEKKIGDVYEEPEVEDENAIETPVKSPLYQTF